MDKRELGRVSKALISEGRKRRKRKKKKGTLLNPRLYGLGVGCRGEAVAKGVLLIGGEFGREWYSGSASWRIMEEKWRNMRG